MAGFDSSTATATSTPQFDPNTASPVSGFDPGSARPFTPPAPRAAGATGFNMVGQTFEDLTNPNHAQHDPNALESGIINTTFSKPVQSLQANYQSAVTNGLFMQPVRQAMESLGVGRQHGESNESLHQRYSAAVDQARQQAAQQAQDNTVGAYDGNPAHVAERVAQQVGNFGAGIAANPQYFFLPGMGIGKSVAARVGSAAAGNAGVGLVSDAAAQLMDMAEGQKKDFDIEQNLKSTLAAGVFGGAMHGAVEVAPFVKSLFSARGMDTKPAANPIGSTIQPMTTDHVAMNAADHTQYQHLLATGSVDDIKDFFKGKQGPQPSWTDVNTWVEHRDGPHPESVNGQPGGPNSEMQPDFNYNDEYNKHAQDQYATQNRQAVEDHIQAKMAGWKNAPEVEVVHSPADIADPAIKAQVTKDDPKGDALGVFGADGKLRVFSGRISDPDTASAVLYHEGLGHFGLAQKFGSRLDQTLQSMLDRNVNQFSRDTDAWIKRNPGAYNGDRVRAAEEVLAERSENGKLPRSWKDAIGAAVNQFGRKMGLKLAYTDPEINHILAMSHDAVVNGTDARGNGFRGAKQDPNKFMFIGPKARGFDPNDPTAITASDGRIRNEISDRRARLYESPGDTLGSTLHHPELFERYPELHSLPVRHEIADGYDGYYDTDGGNHILLNPQAWDDKIDVALHETQHAIQHIEESDHFMRALKEGGTANDSDYDYNNHPSEIEARAVEKRRFLTDQQRIEQPPPKFMRSIETDELGREKTNPDELDFVDRLKADPRYWKDREYRLNVNELARTRFPVDGEVSKFITRAQLERSRGTKPGYSMDDIEGVAQHIEENYTPLVMTREEIRKQAIENGINPDEFKERDQGELATRLSKIGYAANYAGIKVKGILDRLDTPDWKPEDHVKLAEAIAQRNALVEMFKGEGNELGRALNTAKVFKSLTNGHLSEVMAALREDGSGLASLADPTSEDGLKFARNLKAALASNSNPQAANILMKNVSKPYWEQYLNTFHMNAMLSALSTHVKAPIDMATGITRNVIEKVVAMPIGQVRQLYERMTGKSVQSGVETAELVNHLHGLLTAVSDMEVYRAALHAVRTGESSYVTNGKRTPTNFSNTFGALSNPRIKDVGPIPVSLLNKPTDLISAQDTVFRSVEMNAQLLTIATREARDTLGPKASLTDVMTLGKTLARSPTPTMLKEAFAETNRTLLLNDNPLNTIINRARTYRPGMTGGQRVMAFFTNMIAPFIRVESNSLLNRVIQRSPLALIDPTGYTQSQLKAGGAKADIAMAKIAYGSVLLGMMWVAAGAVKDKVTGNGPDDMSKFKQLEAGGWRPNAVHEGNRYDTGNELGMSINPFDMHNKTAQLVASMRQAYEAGANQGQWASGLMLAAGSLFHNIAGMSFISDMQPAVDAVTAHGKEGQNVVSSFVGHEAATWVPNGLSQTARMTDPYQRDIGADGSPLNQTAGEIGHDVQSVIPGLRTEMPIKYSVYGTPLMNGANLTGVHTMIPGLSGNGTTETIDPAERELDRLNVVHSTSVVTPVTKSITLDDGTKLHLNPSQFEEYQHVAGRKIVESVRGLMSTSAWQSMSDDDRVQQVKDIQTDAKRDAREELFNQ